MPDQTPGSDAANRAAPVVYDDDILHITRVATPEASLVRGRNRWARPTEIVHSGVRGRVAAWWSTRWSVGAYATDDLHRRPDPFEPLLKEVDFTDVELAA